MRNLKKFASFNKKLAKIDADKMLKAIAFPI